MVVKFFMLQSHYRSTLDLTDEALQAAEKGYKRLMEAHRTLVGLSAASAKAETALDKEIKDLIQRLHEEMNDDFNTPKALAVLFEIVTKINSLKAGHLKIADLSPAVLAELKQIFHDFVFEVMALQDELSAEGGGGKEAELLDGIMQLVIEMRQDARTNKDWGTADKIRDTLKELNLVLKDGKDGTNWTIG
jgi:cysteinyl-tRNA synthetase